MILIFFVQILSNIICEQSYKIIDKTNLSQLNIKILDRHRIETNLQQDLQNHDIKKEDNYLEEEQHNESLIESFSSIIDQGFESIQEDLYVVKYENNETELYTKKLIKKQTAIGLFTGVITNSKDDQESLFIYQSQINEQLFLQTKNESSLMKYAKQQQNANCIAFDIVYENLWYALILTDKDIQKDEQITISFDYNDDKVIKSKKTYTDISDGMNLQHEDFPLFNLIYLQDVKVEKQLSYLIKNHDITLDKEYLDSKDYYETSQLIYEYELQNLPILDDIIYFKYIQEDIGYGVFAKNFIGRNKIVGKYTGVIQQKYKNTDYAWQYYSQFYEYGIEKIVIDSKKEGNMLRFVNDLGIHNIRAVILPYQNSWNVYYETIIDIEIDEQLSISYGKDYWKAREQIVQKNKKQYQHQEL